MYPGKHAATTPDKPAVIMAGSGASRTYAELEERSRRLAQLYRHAGLEPGDHVAILMENNVAYFEAFWGAYRAGLYFTTINRYLQVDEAAYILGDCGAKALITSVAMAELAGQLPGRAPDCAVLLAVDGLVDGFDRYEERIAEQPAERLDTELRGDFMLYSSGTTGRPKGIMRPLTGFALDDEAHPMPMVNLLSLFGFDGDTVYLSPAPLYHSAPLGFTSGVVGLGGTNVVMERFDPEEALSLIDRHRVTHSQWVPTMFSRMLKLPDEAWKGHDWSSHRAAVHAAAPCPVEVKRQMFERWGPIIWEYYAGTELNGFVLCPPQEWLDHPGTVGRPIVGTLHICDETGAEVPVGEAGLVYFERDAMPFEYHHDPDKTRSAQHPEHPTWSALGDVGYVDDDGYLYLTDRKAFMIISGGVNIYPQEIEDCLVMHPKVADVAVFGIPNDDMGEEVKAVVQPLDGIEPSDGLAAELTEYARQHIAHYKVPRSIDFTAELPRLPTGKLYKRLLRDDYLRT